MGTTPPCHIVAFCAIYGRSTMAQTGVSGLVVVDGESFLDALFASAGQGRGTRKHRLQVDGRSRRQIDWRQPAGGALEATHSRLLGDFQSCNSKLIRALWEVSRRCQVRGAPVLDLHNPSLLARLAPRRKLLVQTLMLPCALSSQSWSGATAPFLDHSRGCCRYGWCKTAHSRS